jgi:hypothetical protein
MIMKRMTMKTKKENREAKDLKEAEQKAKKIIGGLPIRKKPTVPMRAI